MVDADMGVTFLPEMAADSTLIRDTRVETYDISDKSFRTIGLAWRKGSARREEFEVLGKFLNDLHAP